MNLQQFECVICRASRASVRINIVVLSLGGLVALITPEDVLNQSHLLSNFCDFMGNIFPVIEHYGSKSYFPDVTRLYMSLMFLFFPTGFLAILCTLNPDKKFFVPFQDSILVDIPVSRYFFGSVFFIFVFPLLVYFNWFLNPGFDLAILRYSESRWSLALFGGFITLMTPYLLGASVHLIVRVGMGIWRVIGKALHKGEK